MGMRDGVLYLCSDMWYKVSVADLLNGSTELTPAFQPR